MSRIWFICVAIGLNSDNPVEHLELLLIARFMANNIGTDFELTLEHRLQPLDVCAVASCDEIVTVNNKIDIAL